VKGMKEHSGGEKADQFDRIICERDQETSTESTILEAVNHT